MDREALGHLATLMGEASMTLDGLERRKSELDREITSVEREIQWTTNRAAWLEEAHEALRVSQVPFGEHDWTLEKFDEDHDDETPAQHLYRCTFCGERHTSEHEELDDDDRRPADQCDGVRMVGPRTDAA